MQRGFSLVELSIVLVILGLLTGGILAGQSLIRAAEVRSVTADFQRYDASIKTFRDKYMAIPGDMANATSFWGTATTCPGALATPSTTAATCNGDGNGRLSESVSTSNEIFRFWQHLANAGLIEGSYTGVANSATAANPYALVGTNVPDAKISSTGWGVYTWGTVTTASLVIFEGEYGNALTFGLQNATNLPVTAALKAEEAWNLDIKLDDGKPGTGFLVIREDQNVFCHDAAAAAATALATTVNYSLNATAVACSFVFRSRF